MRTMKREIENLASRIQPGSIGSSIRFIETVDSTNRLALELSDSEAHHGLVLVAREQTAGRGRQGRSWLSLPDLGLHFTAVLRPADSTVPVSPLTFVGALAVHDTLSDFCRAPLDIRWPNDVLLNDAKVSGILGEATYKGEKLERVALGISINIAHRQEDFPDTIGTQATSILISEGTAPSLAEVLRCCLENLNRWYGVFESGNFGKIYRELGKRSSYIAGRSLVIKLEGETLEVTSAGLNEDGSLQVRLPSGAELALRSADVRILK